MGVSLGCMRVPTNLLFTWSSGSARNSESHHHNGSQSACDKNVLVKVGETLRPAKTGGYIHPKGAMGNTNVNAEQYPKRGNTITEIGGKEEEKGERG